jgi:alpha-glucosidase
MTVTKIANSWWRGAVLYQVYPISFLDTNDDGIGDIPGITAKLDYIASLGVDGIWLSPVFKSPMRDFGYDISEYCEIDPTFGSMDDFDEFIRQAHTKNLKVIIDQVYSHTAEEHPWFVASRSNRTNAKSDWYVWADPLPDGSPPNNWLSVFGGSAWQWDSRRQQYYFHNYLKQQPDLNLHNGAVQDAILDVARFWLERGVDGFRLDAVNCYMHDVQLRSNPSSGAISVVKPYVMQRHLFDQARPEARQFVNRLRALIDVKPGRVGIAELSSDRPMDAVRIFATGPDALHSSYTFHFLRKDLSAALIRQTLESLANEVPDAWPTLTFGNHDVERVASRWASEGKPYPLWPKTLFALLTSLRGSAFTYQGDELALPQADVPRERLRDPEGMEFWPTYKGRDGGRTPMPWSSTKVHAGFSTVEPWLPLDPRHYALAVDRQNDDPNSMLNFVRKWLRARAGWPAVRTGTIGFLDATDGLVMFLREDEGERFAFVFNLTGNLAKVPWTLGSGWTEPFKLGGLLEDGFVVLPAAAGMVLRKG